MEQILAEIKDLKRRLYELERINKRHETEKELSANVNNYKVLHNGNPICFNSIISVSLSSNKIDMITATIGGDKISTYIPSSCLGRNLYHPNGIGVSIGFSSKAPEWYVKCNVYKKIDNKWKYLFASNYPLNTEASDTIIDEYEIAQRKYFKNRIWPELTAVVWHPSRMDIWQHYADD